MFPEVVALYDANFRTERAERTGVAVELPFDLYEKLADDPASDEGTISNLAAKIIRAHCDKEESKEWITP